MRLVKKRWVVTYRGKHGLRTTTKHLSKRSAFKAASDFSNGGRGHATVMHR